MSAMEWLPAIAILVSIVSAGVAILNAIRAKAAADRAVAVEERRQARRQILADVMESGLQLYEELDRRQRDGETLGNEDKRVLAWYNAADAAVRDADRAQIPRYHQPVGQAGVIGEVRDRIIRLQEIQDRL